MIKSRNCHSIAFIFMSLFSGIAITQAISSNAQDAFDWYTSRTPAELCELYSSGAIEPNQLPGGRSSDPCSDFPTPDPDQYVIKGEN